MTKLGVLSAKVAIKLVIISNHFGKNLWCTFTQMLNEISFIFKLIKSWAASKYTAQQLKRPRKKKYTKKSTTTLIWQKKTKDPETQGRNFRFFTGVNAQVIHDRRI